jgi:ABC-2 type transport system ATP-binding protein
MSDNIAIKVDGVSKSFKLPHERKNSIKSLFVSMFRGKRTYEKQQVLNDVSFEIKKGEFFGIVGRNGSGKSTLLKLLAGIYTPDKGSIHINGKLTPFIELGVGFNPELTGRENVFLNGALLGFNRKEMEAMYDEIVAFAELEKFMDQKLKNYSSGMQVRLAFSIAIRAESEVLLIDEVLAVGDAAFQRKCFNIFNQIKRSGRTVVFVTHDMAAVEQFCQRAILLDKGVISLEGKSREVGAEYQKIMMKDAATTTDTATKISHYGTGAAEIKSLEVLNGSNMPVKKITEADEKLKMQLKGTFIKDSQNPIFGLTIRDPGGAPFIITNTKVLHAEKTNFLRGDNFCVNWEISNVFNNGEYLVTPAVADQDGITMYDVVENYKAISSQRSEYMGGPVFAKQTVKITREE